MSAIRNTMQQTEVWPPKRKHGPVNAQHRSTLLRVERKRRHALLNAIHTDQMPDPVQGIDQTQTRRYQHIIMRGSVPRAASISSMTYRGVGL